MALDHRQVVAEAADHALQGRAPDVAEAMVQAEADQGALGVRVVQRCLLAEEIGQQDEPVGAGRGGGGFDAVGEPGGVDRSHADR